MVLVLGVTLSGAIQWTRADDPPAKPDADRAIVGPRVDEPLDQLLDRLNAGDSEIRSAAREKLMLLTRDDLPSLLEVVRKKLPLSPTQLAELRQIVLHVYLTHEHGFEGDGSGFLGVTGPGNLEEPALIRGRTIGYDAYRVLREGDTIVGMQVQRGPGVGEMKRIESFSDLRQVIVATHPGNWILVRVIRNGQPVEVTVHLASRIELVGQANGQPTNENPNLPRAKAYWNLTFAPVLEPAATQPAADAENR